jgi:hypothetical protein
MPAKKRIDPFTARRIQKFIENYRVSSGQLPTLTDFDEAGFPKEKVEDAVKDDLIEEFYVTLTSGTIRKGYKLKQDTPFSSPQ